MIFTTEINKSAFLSWGSRMLQAEDAFEITSVISVFIESPAVRGRRDILLEQYATQYLYYTVQGVFNLRKTLHFFKCSPSNLTRLREYDGLQQCFLKGRRRGSFINNIGFPIFTQTKFPFKCQMQSKAIRENPVNKLFILAINRTLTLCFFLLTRPWGLFVKSFVGSTSVYR